RILDQVVDIYHARMVMSRHVLELQVFKVTVPGSRPKHLRYLEGLSLSKFRVDRASLSALFFQAGIALSVVAMPEQCGVLHLGTHSLPVVTLMAATSVCKGRFWLLDYVIRFVVCFNVRLHS